jgi:hypothetical protein
MSEKDLGITEVRGAKANIPDIVVYGDGDTFHLLCKASSKDQGWMKSTKVCNVYGGCIVQATTQQKNPDGSYAVAEALTYVPGCMIAIDAEPRKIIKIPEDEELIEKLSEKVHNSWMEEKKAQGFHAPRNCPSESHKDYDRVTVRTVLNAMEKLSNEVK